MTLRWYQFFLKTKYRVKIQQLKRLFYILAKKSEYQLHKNKQPTHISYHYNYQQDTNETSNSISNYLT